MDTPTRVEVCCDPTCANNNVAQIIPLTDEEIAAQEEAAIIAEAERIKAETEAQAIAAAKEAAHAKLAALGLTPDEIAALSK